jgi:hypothetical protein
VAPVDAHRQVLEQPNLPPSTAVPVVAGERDEVEVVDDGQGAREVSDEDDRRLQRGDEDRLATFVVGGDLRPELGDPGPDLLVREIDLADPRIGFERRPGR